MGTISWSVKIDQLPEGMQLKSAETIITKQLEDVNRLMSTYRADSEVSRFNSSQSTEWFEVASETADVVTCALEFSKASDGAFDVTVAPLVNLWHFGPDKSNADQLPTQEQIASALQHVGYGKLHVEHDPPALRKDDPQLQIDLSAIAKGYAVDQVARALSATGISSFLVEVGGEVVVRGKKSNGEPWHVGIVRPTPDEMAYDEVAAISDIAMATSGDYRNFFVVGGKRYSHTIDPQTGCPVENPMASASVIAPDCTTADALATAVMVLGADRGHALCKKLRLPLLTFEHAANGFRERRSDDFPLAQSTAKSNALLPTIVSAILIFALAIAAMAVGVIFGKRRIQGSCGGLAGTTDEEGNPVCSLCSNPSTECRQRTDSASNSSDTAQTG